MKYKILLVGAGQLGSRYLQGIKKLKLDVDVYVVDINQESLDISKDRWSSIETKYNQNCFFYRRYPTKIKTFDLAIISTTANVRLDVIKKVLSYFRVKNWILEKLLAQNSSDILEISHLLKNDKAWVNTCDRTFEWFKKIKSKKIKSKNSYFKVKGNRWAMISNGIHLIDFYEWWTGEKLVSVDSDNLNKKWFNSKRKGFMETTGSIHCDFSRGSYLIFECKNDRFKPISQKYFLDEWTINKTKGRAKNQSGIVISGGIELMSNKVTEFVTEIITKGSCELSSLKDSSRIHHMYIDSILQKWNTSNKKKITRLNIT